MPGFLKPRPLARRDQALAVRMEDIHHKIHLSLKWSRP